MAYQSISPDPSSPQEGAYPDGGAYVAGAVTSPRISPMISDEMLSFAELAASCDHPVLLYGDTGSGKTYLARDIHRRGLRASRPFVRVNCAAIPESLFEREMFGHVRGAFTGAGEAGTGFFEAADGGILFLDEVGEIPVGIQPKLLAALEEGCFWKLGSPREVQVDVQIIAATNRDLGEMVRQKQFRQDLFYRLSVLQYRVPPLRERVTELPCIVESLLRRNSRPGHPPLGISEEAMERLLCYTWPGNIREMENALCAAAVFARGGEIQVRHLPREIRSGRAGARAGGDAEGGPSGSDRYVAPPDPDQEIRMLREALQATGGNKSAAARRLGMSRSTLWAKLKEHRIRPREAGGAVPPNRNPSDEAEVE